MYGTVVFALHLQEGFLPMIVANEVLKQFFSTDSRKTRQSSVLIKSTITLCHSTVIALAINLL